MVEFLDDNSMAVVPNNWIIEKGGNVSGQANSRPQSVSLQFKMP